MVKHVYKYFRFLHIIGHFANYLFIRYDETTNKLYEIKGWQKNIRLILVSAFLIWVDIDLLYYIMQKTSFTKDDIASCAGIPVLIWSVVHLIMAIKNDQTKLKCLIENLQEIHEILSTYKKKTKMNRGVYWNLTFLNIVLLNSIMISTLIVYIYFYHQDLKLYVAVCIYGFVSFFLTMTTSTCLYVCADQMCTFDEIIKQFGNNRNKCNYCNQPAHKCTINHLR